ncbi:adaptor-related protein complex 3, delta 1 subunit-like garnet isoform X2 [Haematobia irritans]|uniref:adaptor-related protein complex 3, delta 1 subunit-like garnet isoform X2 n=1 Tax=Haematobia irritans TaxID=7368 RepID=UPI003F5057A3
MALKKVKGNFERMFDKNLTDLVRGIRNNKDNEAKYISQCIEEIKQELRQDNINVKCNAVAKLTYIQMLGYDISWAGFNIIEVMSSSRFTCKRIGYLAASQCFHPDSELLMLTTNMIRKDLNSQNQYDAGVALSGLSCFISPDLSRDLANDIMTLMSSTKPYLRMKAVLMMYKVFLRYPEALKPAFPKLKEKLEDPDPGVQSAAVNVVCELARKNPKNYLPLAPVFFKLMTTSTNNWMLIKIIKLFASLTTIEPALGRKLTQPLIEIISSTSAMSLLYECINTVIAVLISISSGMPNHSASIQLCVQKLRILIEDSDQNLKYLGLLAMSKILKTHPKSVQAHKDLILACLDDKDESIRLRALDLLYGMVSKKNLMEIVKRLLGHMERAEGSNYRDELLYKVIEICSQSSYLYVTNFEWYLTVLVELIQLEAGSKHGRLIAEQLLDVAIRVPVVRQFAVKEMTSLLDTFSISSQSNSMYEVLYAAAWIVGEFSNELEDAEHTLNILLRPRQVPGHIQSVFVQNVIKLFTRLATTCLENEDPKGLVRLCNHVLEKLQEFNSSDDIEVQERANSACVLIDMLKAQFDEANMEECNQNVDFISSDEPIEKPRSSTIPTLAIEIVQEMALLFAGDLIPVAPKAQRKVPLPDGLDLDEWINPPPEDDSDESSHDDKEELFVSATAQLEENKRRPSEELTPEQIERQRMQRMIEQSNNPHYLKSSPSTPDVGSSNARSLSSNNSQHNADQYDNIDDIPIAELSLDIPLKVGATKRSDQYLLQEKANSKEKRKHKKSKKSKKSKSKTTYNTTSDSEDEPKPMHIVNTTLDMPEGVSLSDGDDKDGKFDSDDPHRALDIELDIPDLEEPKYRNNKKDSTETEKEKKLKSSSTSHKKEKKKDKEKDKENERHNKSTHKKTSSKSSTTAANNNEVNSANLLGTSLEELQQPINISNTISTTNASIIPTLETTQEKRKKHKSHKSSSSTKELKTLQNNDNNDTIDTSTKAISKKKKEKKEHHHKDKKKSSRHHKSSAAPINEYEEALGISTPSKEIF